MTKGDNIDNDCDGLVDEESCDNIDNDRDGSVDEDCEIAGDDAVGNKYVIMFIENNVDDNDNAQSFVEVFKVLFFFRTCGEIFNNNTLSLNNVVRV